MTQYDYPTFSVENMGGQYMILKGDATDDITLSQKKLFTCMLNYGYISFTQGPFTISDKDIATFWQEAHKSILTLWTLEQYYSTLDLPNIYTQRTPIVKDKGSFYANTFNLYICWANTSSKIYTTPLAYKQNGLILKDFKENILGSINPDIYLLYDAIANANAHWSRWELKKRYDFIKDIMERYDKAMFSRTLIDIKKNIK